MSQQTESHETPNASSTPRIFLINHNDLSETIQAITASGAELVGYRHGVIPAQPQEAIPSDIDLIVTDLEVLQSHGVFTLRRIREERPDRPVVVYTPLRDIAIIGEAYKAGARAYVVKDFNDYGELHIAIRTVLNRGTFISSRYANALIDYLTHAGHVPQIEQLLNRTERNILALLYRGYDRSAIAQQLSLEVSSVRTIISNIRKKLNFSDYDCWRLLLDTRYPDYARQIRETP